MSYCLSLMRAHNGEHRDSLPVLDVSALRHVAYVFDALVYYMRSFTEPISPRGETQKETTDTTWNDQVKQTFESTRLSILINVYSITKSILIEI